MSYTIQFETNRGHVKYFGYESWEETTENLFRFKKSRDERHLIHHSSGEDYMIVGEILVYV